MTRKRIAVSLVALVAAAPLLPSPAVSASPSTDHPALPPAGPVPAPRWGHPPEVVRMAVAALHDACAAWPKQIPPVTEPSSSLPAEADQPYLKSCSLALDPGGFAQVSLLQNGALGAMAGGIAFVAFQVAKFLLSGLVNVIARGMTVLWDRRRRRLDGWPE